MVFGGGQQRIAEGKLQMIGGMCLDGAYHLVIFEAVEEMGRLDTAPRTMPIPCTPP